MSHLAFEGRVEARRGDDSFVIIGEGGEPRIVVENIRNARRIGRDFRCLQAPLGRLAEFQHIEIHVGTRWRAVLGGTGRGGARATLPARLIGRLLGLPLTRVWYAARREP
ncbi:MAG: hypothetical protein LAT64_13305 [Phycisphaerales bacterium]|nr:hypothetical protein [Planctomycetota bacterium]MCH8509732.1 hypothetical protein [Phycisphaerales bacterium]